MQLVPWNVYGMPTLNTPLKQLPAMQCCC